MSFEDIFKNFWQDVNRNAEKISKQLRKDRMIEIINGNIRFATAVLPMLDDIIIYTQKDNPIRQAILRVPELKYVVEEIEYDAKRKGSNGFGDIKHSVKNCIIVLAKLQRFIEVDFAKNDEISPEEVKFRLQHIATLLGTMRATFRYISLLASMVRVTAIDYTHPDLHLNVKTLFGEKKLKRVKDNFELMLTTSKIFGYHPDDIIQKIEHIPVFKKTEDASLYVPKWQIGEGVRLANLTSIFDKDWVKSFFNPTNHNAERAEMSILETLEAQADTERKLIQQGALVDRPTQNIKEAKIERARLLGRINNFRTTIDKLEDTMASSD